jgi:hypothetical protein
MPLVVTVVPMTFFSKRNVMAVRTFKKDASLTHLKKYVTIIYFICPQTRGKIHTGK